MTKHAYWLVGAEHQTRKVRLSIQGPILIGRGSYNHVVLDDPRVSRQHARLTPEGEGTVLYDLSSTNGTSVNGVPVQVCRPVELDDEISVGNLKFSIQRGALEERPPEGPRTSGSRVRETPTLRDLNVGSSARILGAMDSTKRLPVVDLGQLEDAHAKLNTLYSFIQAIGKTIERRELLELIARQIQEVYESAISVGIYVHVRDKGVSAFRLAHLVVAGTSTPLASADSNNPTLSDDITTLMLHSPRAILAAGPSDRTTGGPSMYAPMIDRSETLGVIRVAADARPRAFSSADLDLLNGMAAPAAMMLQNARIHDESLRRDRLSYDLELAAQIQRSFLPREVISVEGIELFAEYRAAYSVGGDFYDVFWIERNRLGILIGDIAGKGVAGALLMARISSQLRAVALAQADPVAVLTTMNKTLIALNQPELFFTAIYLTLDVTSGEISLVNAGHPQPYCLRSNGTLEAVTEAAAPVGILDEPAFTATPVTLAHGDSLVLYTDGVVEAADAQGCLYGSERLEACLSFAGTRPHVIAEHILHSVQQHTADAPANDDLTLFICHRNIGKPPSLQPQRRSGMTRMPMIPPGAR